MIRSFKNLWRYLKNYKGLLVSAIITIIISQALLLAAPLLVKTLLDDYISGIEQPFFQVQQQDAKTVKYQNQYFKQKKYIQPKEKILSKRLQIVGNQHGFFLTDKILPSGTRTIDAKKKQIIITQNQKNQFIFPAKKMSLSELQTFYTPSFQPIQLIILLIFLRSLLSIIFSYLQKMTTAFITINITKDARLAGAASLHKMSIAELQAEPAGKLSARIVHDVTGLMILFSVIINIFFNATLGLIFTYIGMFYLNPTLAFLTFIIFPLIYFWLRIFSQKLYKVASRAAEVNSLLISKINEVINGINILQIFNQQEQARENFNVLSHEFVGEQMKEIKFHLGIGWNLIRLFKNVFVILILLYFGWMYFSPWQGIVLAGTVYAYIDYVSRMIDPLDTLFMEFGNLQHAIVKTERIFTLIDTNTEEIHKEYVPRFKGNIRFQNVNFAYKENQDYILKDINLNIPAGKMIGLVGRTGSGKSSMMSLLMRFYDLKESDTGTIFVDHHNICHLSKQTYRQHIGIILQSPTLFSGTLADNIRFGKEGVLDREIEEVLLRVGGKKILEKFPQRLHEQVTSSGDNLSVGEQQIIAFARALIHDPAILIMDEATANMDTETEKLIQDALKVVAKGRTLIIIAHRLATIREADSIIVLDQGKIVEQANHQDLLAADGFYANMYRSQAEL